MVFVPSCVMLASAGEITITETFFVDWGMGAYIVGGAHFELGSPEFAEVMFEAMPKDAKVSAVSDDLVAVL